MRVAGCRKNALRHRRGGPSVAEAKVVALQSELDKTMPGTRGSNEKSGSGLPKMRLASPALDFLVRLGNR